MWGFTDVCLKTPIIYVYMCVCDRERERKRERGRKRWRERQRGVLAVGVEPDFAACVGIRHLGQSGLLKACEHGTPTQPGIRT